MPPSPDAAATQQSSAASVPKATRPIDLVLLARVGVAVVLKYSTLSFGPTGLAVGLARKEQR